MRSASHRRPRPAEDAREHPRLFRQRQRRHPFQDVCREGAVKGELPPNNGLTGTQGSVYEGGTRVARLPTGGTSSPHCERDDARRRHVPTFASLAGAQLGKNKPLDGVDVWSTISEGKASPRDEIVYNIEPYRGGVRKGDMKLVWLALLPPNVELFIFRKILPRRRTSPIRIRTSQELQARTLELASRRPRLCSSRNSCA